MARKLTIPSIFTAVDKFSPKVKKMSAVVSSFARKAEVGVARVDRAFRKLTSPIRRLGKQLGSLGLVLGFTAIIGIVGSATKVFIDFEQANANLSSVMASATGPELASLQKDAMFLGATTAKTATEVVGLQEAFARLGFTTPAILNMTQATIDGSIAMRGELADTAELVGAMIKTFDDFSSLDTPAIIDKMTLATQKSALNFEKLQTSLPIVAGAANAAGIPFNRLLALLGKLSDSGIDASSSSTALRNIFLKSAKAGLSYEQILDKIVKNQDSLTAATDKFGVRAAVSGVILAKNLKETDKLTEAIEKQSKGAAAAAAAKQLDTLGGALTILNSAWEGWILSMEDGNGALSTTLKQVTRVATDILSLASGTAKATDKLDKMGKKTRIISERVIFFGKVIGTVIGFFVAMKIAIVLAKGVLIAWKAIVGIATAAQWLWNAAMSANPIGLIIIGIVLLVALIGRIIQKWDTWGAALSIFLGPLGLIISMIQSFRRNWEMIKEAFKTGGMIGGLKSIGATLLDSILMPLQQLLEIIERFDPTGVAGKAAESIEKFRANIGVETGSEVINPEAGKQAALANTIEKTNNAKVDINVNDPNGRADVQSEQDFVSIRQTSTLNFGI